MADLIPMAESEEWVPQIHQRPAGEPLTGGAPDLAADQGFANVQAQQLAKRSLWLKAQVDQLALDAWTNANNPKAFLGDGYQVFKSGLILQWGLVGSVGVGVAGQITGLLPIAYPNGFLRGFASRATESNQSAVNMIATCVGISRTQFTILRPSDGAGPASFQWMAIGW
jgi:hypothetical protein